MYSVVAVICIVAALIVFGLAARDPELRQYRKIQNAKAYWAKLLEKDGG